MTTWRNDSLVTRLKATTFQCFLVLIKHKDLQSENCLLNYLETQINFDLQNCMNVRLHLILFFSPDFFFPPAQVTSCAQFLHIRFEKQGSKTRDETQQPKFLFVHLKIWS